MTPKTYDVVGIGNAIVDVLSKCDETFLDRIGSFKGTMLLVDEAQAHTLYQEMKHAIECSGGSVANSLSGLASLGGKAAFIGKVRNDQLGEIFRHDMQSVGVHFSTPPAETGAATARSLVLVTPDGQRTMHTYLGICSDVREEDIDEDLIAKSKVVYIEGYLWDQHGAIRAIRRAIDAAKKHGTKVAFSLSDLFCVERHRMDFLELIENDLDIIFANEAELKALYTTMDYEVATGAIAGKCELAVLTRGEKGSRIVTRDGAREDVPASAVENVVDTTGAGDLFASGFLYGYTRGWDHRRSATLAAVCAAEVIQQMGARVARDLRELAEKTAA